jgi:TonB family protein
MKLLQSLAFLWLSLISYAQTTTEYFTDRYLTKQSSVQKAKFIRINTRNPDGSSTTEIVRTSDQTTISIEHYRNEEPIGIWIVYQNNKRRELNYDFPLVYDNQDTCAMDSNTFLPALEMGQRDPLKDFDSIGYVAPIADFSKQDMLKQLFYPIKAIDDGLMGEVLVGFRISETGEISSMRVLQGAHPLLDKEAVRCFRLLRFRTSAFVNGVPKAICVKQRLTFRME